MVAKSAKIERTQKLFLTAMKKKFATDPTIPTTFSPVQMERCPICNGNGRRKGAFCHECGGSGKRVVR